MIVGCKVEVNPHSSLFLWQEGKWAEIHGKRQNTNTNVSLANGRTHTTASVDYGIQTVTQSVSSWSIYQIVFVTRWGKIHTPTISSSASFFPTRTHTHGSWSPVSRRGEEPSAPALTNFYSFSLLLVRMDVVELVGILAARSRRQRHLSA